MFAATHESRSKSHVIIMSVVIPQKTPRSRIPPIHTHLDALPIPSTFTLSPIPSVSHIHRKLHMPAEVYD
jgi:hypothetical protein